VIFLDEPMSGLDPLGRRDVRTLILELRDEGRTIFFSSHILSDAETLCSRVAILAAGRLQAIGGMHELVEFSVRGWELLLDGVPGSLRVALESRGMRVTGVGDDRVHVHLDAPATPEDVLRQVSAAGARVLSLGAIRETLEDAFVRLVAGKRRETDAGDRNAPQ
jgi:ABC-2 type transport system ATP-binding protein